MRALVYAGSTLADGPAAVGEGLLRHGYSVTHRRTTLFRGPADAEPADIVVVNGLRFNGRYVADAYNDRAVPVLVLDAGFLRREDGYRQLGIGRLNWIPAGPHPSDRRLKIGLHAAPVSDLDGKREVVIFGQKSGDAGHGLSDHELLFFYRRAADGAREAFPGFGLVFRPHPMNGGGMPAGLGACRLSDPNVESLEECWASAAAVISHSSTAGLKARLAGVPAFCHGSAFYADAVPSSLPSVADNETAAAMQMASVEVDAFLDRLAYGQWKHEELASGEAIAYYLWRLGLSQAPDGASYSELASGASVATPEAGELVAARESVAKDEATLTAERLAESIGRKTEAKAPTRGLLRSPRRRG